MTTYLKRILLTVIVLLLTLAPATINAHAPNQSYVFMRIYDESMGGRFEITIDDINTALGLNLRKDITLDELTPYLSTLQAYLVSHTSFGSGDQNYRIRFTETEMLPLENLGTFVQLSFDLEGVAEVPAVMKVGYRVLFEKDPKHQGLLVIEYNWKAGIINNEAMVSLIFTGNDTDQELALADASVLQGFTAMVKMGMWHIWIGLDHILFLLALLLPAVVRRNGNGAILTADSPRAGLAATGILAMTESSWAPVDQFRPAFIYVVKIVTFFTIAHTITLSLAALEIIVLPSRFVESVIALSIGLAAYHNIRPLIKNEVWLIAFGFGLFHGFGFASVLGEKGLGGDYMTLSLLGFNLGVEIGQILIICLLFPILFALRTSPIYGKILVYGSGLLILIALYWFVERSFEVDFLLDNYIAVVFNKVLRVIFG